MTAHQSLSWPIAGELAGIIVCAETVAEAFDAMYYLEQAARLTVKALSTGQKLKLVDDKVSLQPECPHY